jgi:hypothetical protein
MFPSMLKGKIVGKLVVIDVNTKRSLAAPKDPKINGPCQFHKKSRIL